MLGNRHFTKNMKYCFQSKYPAETRKLLLVYELQEYDLVIFDFKHMKHM